MSEQELFAQRRWVGKRVERFEDPGMLTGALRYVTDVQLPRMVDIAFVRSSRPHARIVRIDAEAARAETDVLAVLTHADVVGTTPLVDFITLEGARKTPRFALPAEKVRYVGEPVAAVVAESRYAAEDAVALVQMEYEDLSPDEPIHAEAPDNVIFRAHRDGNVDEVFESAPHVFHRRLDFQRVHATPLETCGIVADYDIATGELTCWVSATSPHVMRAGIATTLGLQHSQVRVICPAMGGAFGSKEVLRVEYLSACIAAIRLRRPVRWVEDRREALTAGVHGREHQSWLDAAFDEDGTLLAMRARFVSTGGAFVQNQCPYIDFFIAAMNVPGAYKLPAYGYEAIGTLSNTAMMQPYRGVGVTVCQALREVVLDDAARAMGIDRVELRRRNLIDDGPWTTVLGEKFAPGSWRSCFERAVQVFDYDEFLGRQQRARGEGRLLGIGFSTFVEMGGIGSEMGVADGMTTTSHDNATVSLDLTGTLTVAVPTFSHGQSHRTSFAQFVADIFGVNPEDVRIVDGDTARTPFGMGSFASRSAVIIGHTVAKAGTMVRDKVKEVAAILFQVPAETLELVDGAVAIKGAPQARIPLANIAMVAQFVPYIRALLGGDPTLTATAFADPPLPTHSNGCIAVEVEVDPETGAVHIERIVAVEDCGTMLNPMVVDGQIRGGIVQGLGTALFERQAYDNDGQPLSSTLGDYMLPRATDLPTIEIEHFETPSPMTPGGMKGVGEGSALATPAAVACAIFDAIAPAGGTIETLPLTTEAISVALQSNTRYRS